MTSHLHDNQAVFQPATVSRSFKIFSLQRWICCRALTVSVTKIRSMASESEPSASAQNGWRKREGSQEKKKPKKGKGGQRSQLS
ncbi:hypothetical protein TNCV_2081841 [Trichonephila clavipes]|nr:hypothetical protein TNCV_2081841 [Trichonephila clavipes]